MKFEFQFERKWTDPDKGDKNLYLFVEKYSKPVTNERVTQRFSGEIILTLIQEIPKTQITQGQSGPGRTSHGKIAETFHSSLL